MMLQKANTNVIATKRPPMNFFLFVCGKYFLSKERQPIEAWLKGGNAIFRKMLHKTCILIWSVKGYLHGEINANEFALVQTQVLAYCQAFDACNGFLSYLQAAAES